MHCALVIQPKYLLKSPGSSTSGCFQMSATGESKKAHEVRSEFFYHINLIHLITPGSVHAFREGGGRGGPDRYTWDREVVLHQRIAPGAPAPPEITTAIISVIF